MAIVLWYIVFYGIRVLHFLLFWRFVCYTTLSQALWQEEPDGREYFEADRLHDVCINDANLAELMLHCCIWQLMRGKPKTFPSNFNTDVT